MYTRATQRVPPDFVEEDEVIDESEGEGVLDEVIEGQEEEEATWRFSPGHGPCLPVRHSMHVRS